MTFNPYQRAKELRESKEWEARLARRILRATGRRPAIEAIYDGLRVYRRHVSKRTRQPTQ